MKIESVDLYYLSMPEVLDIADGSQDALVVRVQAGEYVGWGECDASPLTSIASYVCPMSWGVCKPVAASVLGERLDDPGDIERINARVRENSMDILQAEHTLSGIDIALWDALGRRLDEPVYRLLGYDQCYPKTPYASLLFGDEPQETLHRARQVLNLGYRACKFGWGPFGRGTAEADGEHLRAAREGLGEEGILLVDAGTVWRDDVQAATQRCQALKEVRATWLEEPFVANAVDAYTSLAPLLSPVGLAGGEGCHDLYMARHMIDDAGLAYVQIDAGRIGGISTAKQVADYAVQRGVTYVNHTFTTHLALSASLQPFAGLRDHEICEYPVDASALAVGLTRERILPDDAGQIRLPESPGLGVRPDPETLREYLVDVEIRVGGETIYCTPEVRDTAD